MSTPDALYLDVCEQVADLAHDMVRLEAAARQAARCHDFVRVGELHARREEVQEQRSELMRQMWQMRRKRQLNFAWRVRREALRQA